MKEKPKGIDPLIQGLENVPGINEVVADARRCTEFSELMNIFGRHPKVDLSVIHQVAERRQRELVPPADADTYAVKVKSAA